VVSSACTVHGYHWPAPLRIIRHHIQPEGMGGETAPANLVDVCDTGHMNIHRLMGDLLRGGPMRRGGTRRERTLAQRGYDSWVATGRPGKPVFQLDQEAHP
jgi:hypothetical protein